MFFSVTRDGKALGEFSETMIGAKLAEGELLATDLFWDQATSSWRELAEREPCYAATPSHSPASLKAKEATAGAISITIDSPTGLGLAGSLMTFFGVFAPSVSMPLLGSMSYLQNGRGPGIVIILSAVASIALAAVRQFRYLWLTGSISMLCLAASIIVFEHEIQQMKHSATLRDNMLAGIESAAADATQLGWGYAILFSGALLLLAAAAVGTGKLHFRR